MSKIFERLDKELKSLDKEWIVLLETDPEKSSEVSVDSMKILTDNGYAAVVLSSTRPCENLLRLYKRNGIDSSNVLVVDLVCKSQGMKVAEDTPNVLHLESASALTEISIAISKIMDSADENSFIFIDSITTMLMHNRPETFARFIHSTLTKMRMKGVNGLMVIISGETDSSVRAEIAQLCDKVIKV